MVAEVRWLIDKSAYVRLSRSDRPELWADRIQRGLVSVATVSLLEFGYSARSGDDWTAVVERPPVSELVVEPLTPAMETRMVEVQGMLAARGYHRAVKIPDLMVAAIAELAGYTVLHVDKDFKLIAEITGQSIERLSGDF